MTSEIKSKKNISVLHEEGMEDIATYAQEAICDILNEIPSVKSRFLVESFGAWREDYYCSNHHGFLPYGSVDWFLDQAEKKAYAQGRSSRQQISASQLVEDLSFDPNRRKNDELMFFLTKQDLYAQNADGSLSDFVYGAYKDKASCVISAKRFYDEDGKRFDTECFKTVVQHYVGRMLGMKDEPQAKDIDPKLRRDCVIQEPENNDFRALTHIRLKRKQVGLGAVCPNCAEQVCQWVKSWDMRNENDDIFGRPSSVIQMMQAEHSR